MCGQEERRKKRRGGGGGGGRDRRIFEIYEWDVRWCGTLKSKESEEKRPGRGELATSACRMGTGTTQPRSSLTLEVEAAGKSVLVYELVLNRGLYSIVWLGAEYVHAWR